MPNPGTMSAEPQFEQFLNPVRAPGPWLTGVPEPRQGLALGLVLVVLTCLPVLFAVYPQMVDYPAHLARYHVMLDQAASPYLQRYYGFEWRWSGNLGADLLIRPLAWLFPLETAGRVLVAAIPLLTGLGILAVDWALRRRIGLASVLAMAFVWSPSLLLGFLNFGLSLAGALFAFAGWVLLEGKRWRAALFVPVGLAVWLCHVSGWGVLGIMVFGHEWSRDKSWRAFLAPWPLVFPLLALVAGGGAGELPSYGPAPEVYKRAIWKQSMRGSLEWLDYASSITVVLVLIGSAALKRWDMRLGWGAAIMLIASLILPRHIFGGDYVDARMISTGLMAGCLALAWRAPRWVLLVAAALFLTRLGYTTMDWNRDSRETQRLLSALDQVPRGARVANIVVTERAVWGYNGQEHICGYLVVRKDALTNCNFALPGVHMLTIREGGRLFRDPYHRMLHWAGTPIDLSNFEPARHADWLWYVGQMAPRGLPAGYVTVAQGPHWLLAQKRQRLAKPRRHS
jgi:hypothetical protein